MLSDSLNTSPVPKPKSLESLKETFKQRLDGILHKQLTVENIETFAGDAYSETEKLNDEILQEYRNNPELHGDKTLKGKVEEDDACRVLDLLDISKILKQIEEKREEIEKYKNADVKQVNTVITPTEPRENTNIIAGDGSFKKKEKLPRTLTLLYLLENDLEMSLKDIKITQGIVTSEMLRRTPYSRVEIPKLKRVVYVCDEEDNVTHIFDTEKLKAAGHKITEIDLDYKGDKDSLIALSPGIGIRIIQSENWRDYVALALKEDIPITQTNTKGKLEKEERERIETSQENIPVVAMGELDSWRGFWTDENGMHWGSRSAISKKLKKTFIIFKRRIEDTRLKITTITSLIGRSQDGYCFEQFMGLFPELQEKKRPEKKGEWRGFWTDPQTGKHWGAASAFKKKLDLADWETIKRYITKANLQHLTMEDINGREAKVYCYEDFLEVEEFLDFMTAPQADKEGKWQGFLIDDKDQHWAPIWILSSYFNIGFATLSTYVKKMNLVDKRIKTTTGEIQTAFCLESLQKSKEFMEFINLPKTAKEGIWTGFWTDKDGNHWGTIRAISKKLNTDRKDINKLINENPGKFTVTNIKNVGGHAYKGFCLEEIEKELAN